MAGRPRIDPRDETKQVGIRLERSFVAEYAQLAEDLGYNGTSVLMRQALREMLPVMRERLRKRRDEVKHLTTDR